MYIVASTTITQQPLSSQFQSLSNALELVQSILKFKFKNTTPRVWFVTRNATWVQGGEINLLASPIWGFGASICLEHPHLSCKRVDMDSEAVSCHPFLFCFLF